MFCMFFSQKRSITDIWYDFEATSGVHNLSSYDQPSQANSGKFWMEQQALDW